MLVVELLERATVPHGEVGHELRGKVPELGDRRQILAAGGDVLEVRLHPAELLLLLVQRHRDFHRLVEAFADVDALFNLALHHLRVQAAHVAKVDDLLRDAGDLLREGFDPAPQVLFELVAVVSQLVLRLFKLWLDPLGPGVGLLDDLGVILFTNMSD